MSVIGVSKVVVVVVKVVVVVVVVVVVAVVGNAEACRSLAASVHSCLMLRMRMVGLYERHRGHFGLICFL